MASASRDDRSSIPSGSPAPDVGAHDDRVELGIAGFGDGDRYHRARPGYPAVAVDHLVAALGIGAGSPVLDLGAGTGLFTRELVARGCEVTAVEPTPGMRDVLAASLPSVRVLDGRDTAIPLDDASVDAVTVAQAFHWFDAPRALVEIHRVLVARGRLGLVWNERDETVDWVEELSVAMEWHERQPYPVGMDFAPVVAAGPFTDVERHEFRHTQRLDHDGVLDRVATTSYLAVMPDDRRDELMARVAAVVAPLPEIVDLPYVTRVYVATAA